MKFSKFNLVCIILLSVFFLAGVIDLFREAKDLYKTGRLISGVSEHEKKLYLLGDEYIFAWLCKQIIPEKANALFITNTSSSHGSIPVFISYELYPVKLYFLNKPNPYPDIPPSIKEIDKTFLERYGINWLIFRYTDPLDKNLVVRLKKGQEVKRYLLNIRDRTYHAVP